MYILRISSECDRVLSSWKTLPQHYNKGSCLCELVIRFLCCPVRGKSTRECPEGDGLTTAVCACENEIIVRRTQTYTEIRPMSRV